jgi:hypothetical protein
MNSSELRDVPHFEPVADIRGAILGDVREFTGDGITIVCAMTRKVYHILAGWVERLGPSQVDLNVSMDFVHEVAEEVPNWPPGWCPENCPEG